MSLPIDDPLPLDPPPAPPPLRRRRARRTLVPRELEQRAAFFGELVHQATPSVDFFLFSAVAGVVCGAALLFDSPALFILAALLAPFMAPALGLGVATAIGGLRFFFRSLVALLIGGVMIFGLGAAAGALSRTLTGLTFSQAAFHTTFSWADLVLLLLGAGLTALLAVRSPQQRSLVSSVALAYELFLPLAAAGFGLVNPVAGLFPQGLLLFGTHLALAAVTAAFVLLLVGVRPLASLSGWLACLLLLVVLGGAAFWGAGSALSGLPAGPIIQPAATQPVVTPSPAPSRTPSPVPSITWTAASSPTMTGVPLTATITPTNTLVPTATPTITVTPSATPVYGMVNAGELNGVIIRPEPGSLQIVTTLLNGSLVEILPEVVNKAGSFWIHVRTPDGKEGWVQQGLIITATPRPR